MIYRLLALCRFCIKGVVVSKQTKTFIEFRSLSNEQMGAVIRKFMDDDLKARQKGAHSTSQKLAVAHGFMLKILTDDSEVTDDQL